jgi:hypothetical protein
VTTVPDNIYACCVTTVVTPDAMTVNRGFYSFMVEAANYDEAQGRARRVGLKIAEHNRARLEFVSVNSLSGQRAVIDPDKPIEVHPRN